MTALISFSELSNRFPAFTCAGAIGNLRSICLNVIVHISHPVIVNVNNRPCKSLDLLFCVALFDISVLLDFGEIY